MPAKYVSTWLLEPEHEDFWDYYFQLICHDGRGSWMVFFTDIVLITLYPSFNEFWNQPSHLKKMLSLI